MGRLLTALGALGDGAHLVEMGLRVGEQDLLLDILTQRRLLADQPLEDLVPQDLVDGAHAVGPFRMTRTGVVGDEGRMVEE
jgi:hypothetical protein